MLVPDRSQRSYLQCQILSEINWLVKSNPANLKTMTENYIVRTKLIDLLMASPYVQFISDHIYGIRQSALTREVFKLFEAILTGSIPARYISRYLRLHEPLNCGGMAITRPPLRPELYKSILSILSQHGGSNSPQPAKLRLSCSAEKAAYLTVPSFLPVTADSTLSELTSAAGLGGGLTGTVTHSWPPINGFCISMWLTVDSLPEFTRTALPLITICRDTLNGKASYVVLSVLLTRHRQLIITTRELSHAVHNQLEELELDPERCSKVVQNYDAVDSVVALLPERFNLGTSHHLQIQITRGLIKQSLCYLWFDGACVELTNQGKLRYPSGSSSSYQITTSQSVTVTIGGSSTLNRIPTAIWSFSSIHCFNDVLPANSAFNIFEKERVVKKIDLSQ